MPKFSNRRTKLKRQTVFALNDRVRPDVPALELAGELRQMTALAEIEG